MKIWIYILLLFSVAIILSISAHASCVDSDNGNNPNTFGNVKYSTDGNSYCIFNDQCIGTIVKEYYCVNNAVRYIYNNCTTGCNNGKCNGNACIPKTCAQLNKTCGTWSDQCTGTINCTTCTAGKTCDATGKCEMIDYPAGTFCTPGTIQATCNYCNNVGLQYLQNQSKCSSTQTCNTTGQCQANNNPIIIGNNSNKFIQKFFIFYGDNFVAGDENKLAKFDLLDTDRFDYTDIGGATWSKIKAINPNISIYLYEMGPEDGNFWDNADQAHLNNIDRYNSARGHSMGSLNGNHPEMFLLDAGGSRIYNGGSNTAANEYMYLMDFGNTSFQNYWLEAANSDIISQSWKADGIFVDNVIPHGGGYDATPAKYNTLDKWNAAMTSFVRALTTGLHQKSQKVWFNRGDTRLTTGYNIWIADDNSGNPPDVLLEEGAFAVSWGCEAGTSCRTHFNTEDEWKRQLDLLGAVKNIKAAYSSHTTLTENQSGTDNFGKPTTFWQAFYYSLGSFLLGKNDVQNNSYFDFVSIPTIGGSEYSVTWWPAEYDRINFGKSIGTYHISNVGGTNIYWREFEKGYVYVNPTANDVASVNVPSVSKQLTHDNILQNPATLSDVNVITLKSHTAVFLLKSSSLTPPNTNQFLVLQRTYFTSNRPTDAYFSGFGIKPLTIVYENEFGCPPNNEAQTRAASQTYQNQGYNHMIFLNDECVPPEQFDTNFAGVTVASATANMQQMKSTVSWFKNESPGIKVGVYSYAPLPVDIHYSGPQDYSESTYRGLNNLMQPLADSMDFLSPSLYCNYADVTGWEWEARVMIGEAKRLAKGKPVYAFISPQYYMVSGQTGMVSHDYWKSVLQTIKDAGANGTIIFVWNDNSGGPAFDPNAGWWTATKEFMQENNLNG
jgi:hypothetical protein